jgi:oxygen-independent coproporphyrinogen-3 oxidase
MARLIRWRQVVRETAARAGFVRKSWHSFHRPVPAATRFEDGTGSGDQFGIGLSARSRLGHTIYRNHSSISTYLERVEAGRSPVEEVFALSEEDRKIRFIGHTLGVGKPLDREVYRQRFGTSFDDDFAEPLQRLGEADLLTDDGRTIDLSPTGELVFDLVTLAFYPRRIKDWLEERHALAQRRHTLVG